ncbi:MAG: NAD(P)/FAD-dependent oxidoreductase [Pseudomonadota bacterium]
MHPYEIAIIGGGIGGLASAIALARRGAKVTVYERAESPGPVGAGFLLQPPGQAVLGKLGVLDDVLTHAVPITGLQSKTTAGYAILDLDYRDLRGPPRHGLGVQRSTIYSALYHEALRCDDIEFRWGHTVDTVATDEAAASVRVGGDSASYDLCVLSAGANSDLTDQLFHRRTNKAYAWGCVWTTIDLPSGFAPDLLHQRCRRADRMMGILPVLKEHGGYKAALYWSVKVADVRRADVAQSAQIKRALIDFWPEAASSIEPLEQGDLISATYRDVWTPKPYAGRLVAIGDACHATSPQLGQGCTMALLDAYLLACGLEQGAGNIDAALERWWRRRQWQLQYVRQLSRFLTPLYQSDHASFGVFRNAVVAPTGRLPGFYSLQLKTLASEVFLPSID